VRRSPVIAILAIVIAVLVIALGLTTGAPAPRSADLTQYAVSADGKQLVVTAVVPTQCGISRTSADERSDAVQVIVRLSCNGSPSGAAPLVDIPVTLTNPLNGRTVLDANGAAVAAKTP
jgi:hypothetical protein